AVFGAIVVAGMKRRLHLGAHPRTVLGMDLLLERLDRAREGPRLDTVKLLEPGGPDHPPGRDVPLPIPHASGLEREPQPFLARAQIALRFPPIEILAELKPDRGDELDRVVLAVERLSPEELEHSERSPIREDGAGEPDLEPGASRGFGAETIAFLGARKTQGAGGCPRASYDSLSELDEARSRLVRAIAELRSLFAVELRAAQHAPVRVNDPESSHAPFESGHDGL